MRVCIITVSDRAAAGTYPDRSGPAVREFLDEVLTGSWEPVTHVVPDDLKALQDLLIQLCDVDGCSLIITTGGTGPAARDITPDAVAAIAERVFPGFGERMRAVSAQAKATAMLSRQIAASRGATLMITLPGSPGAIHECLEAVFPAIPHCIDLLGGPRLEARSGSAEDPRHG
ncbi:MAG: molybdopterin adenylyltransferase [Planctomycetota bacterium]